MTVENTVIKNLITALTVTIPLGATVRILLCTIAMMQDDDKRSENKLRIKNVIAFVIFAEIAMGIVNLIYHYYK